MLVLEKHYIAPEKKKKIGFNEGFNTQFSVMSLKMGRCFFVNKLSLLLTSGHLLVVVGVGWVLG